MHTAIPKNAHHVSLAQASTVQAALDTYGTVSLDTAADYSATIGTITISSGMGLYGLRSTKVADIVIAADAKDFVLSGLKSFGAGITFTPGAGETKGGLVFNHAGGINATGVNLVENRFIDVIDSQVRINNTGGGYARNNIFTRFMVHGQGPGIELLGAPGRTSYGNTFLWVNLLGANGSGMVVDGQQDITLAGLDNEGWDPNNLGNPASITITDTGIARLMMLSGGASTGTTNDKFLDTGADETWVFGTSLLAQSGTLLEAGPTANRYFSLAAYDINASAIPPNFADSTLPGAFVMEAANAGAVEVLLNGVDTETTPLDSGELSTFRAMLVDSPVVENWHPPQLDPIPDPAGPNWDADLASKPDSLAYIQGLIDSQGIARLPAGIYYISGAIKLKNTQGLIGEGMDTTAIIAKADTINMIISGDVEPGTNQSATFTLLDITLQGGLNGIYTGVYGYQYNKLLFSHVTIRDMAGSGIFLDSCYAWDNNFIDTINLYRCADAGIKQRSDWNSEPGEWKGFAYMDKNVFYRAQIAECGIGVDSSIGGRGMALNSFIDSSIRDCTGPAMDLIVWRALIIANTDFINNGGPTTINNNHPVTLTSCRFSAEKENITLLPPRATAEGCQFHLDGSTTATIGDSTQLFLANCTGDMPFGAISDGVIVNTKVPDAALNNQAAYFDSGAVNAFADGAALPYARYLPMNFSSTILSYPVNFPNASGAETSCSTNNAIEDVIHTAGRLDRPWYSTATGGTYEQEAADAAIIVAGVDPAIAWKNVQPASATPSYSVTGQPGETECYVGWVQEYADAVDYGDDLVQVFRTTTASENITIPAFTGTYDAEILWEPDGEWLPIVASNSGTLSHIFDNPDDHIVRIRGKFPHLRWVSAASLPKLIGVIQIGNVQAESYHSMFKGAVSLEYFATGSVTNAAHIDMWEMCEGWTGVTMTPDFTGFDVSKQTSIRQAFFNWPAMLAAPDFSGFDTGQLTTVQNACANWAGMVADPGIAAWNVESVLNFTDFLSGSQLTTEAYDEVCREWGQNQTLINTTDVNMGTSMYTDTVAREALRVQVEDVNGHTLIDGGEDV